MREPTVDEKETREKRRLQVTAMMEEMAPVLGDFAVSLDLPNPHMIVAEPGRYLPKIDEFMQDQVVEEDDRPWILTRLGYFIGEVLISRLGGCWFLNDRPDTRFFLRCVVGQFGTEVKPNAMVDPFEAADAFLAQPPGRGLAKFIEEIEAGCRV